MKRADNAAVPRLRDSVAIYQEGACSVRFVRTSQASDVCFEVDDLALAIITSLDRVQTAAELCDAVAHVPGCSPERVGQVLELLCEEHLALPAEEPADRGTTDGESRYDRQHRLFREWIADGVLDGPSPVALQQRLGASTVTIIGLGGVGGAVARSLATAGVGHLRLCDPDVVQLSNLNRQSLFGDRDVGRPKVEVVAERLAQQNETIETRLLSGLVGPESDMAPLVDGADLVVNCADNPSVHLTSDWIASACVRANVPHIVGGGYGYRLGILGTTVVPGTTVCWACIRRATERDVTATGAVLIRPVQRPTGVLGALAEALAAIVALDALLVLLGAAPRLRDGITELDPLTFELRRRPVAADPRCRTCAPVATSKS